MALLPGMVKSFSPIKIMICYLLAIGTYDPADRQNPYPSIGAIPLPAGYHRIISAPATFTTWLRNIPLKKNRTVYLFNGSPKGNQGAQFAVLDVTVGRQDLQQCADAVMRLRSEYLYSTGRYGDISYSTEQGALLSFQNWQSGHRMHLSGNRLVSYPTNPVASPAARRMAFEDYLLTVFTYCGTRSLEKQLLPVTSFRTISAGDVLIRGGSPGHAMLVADIAEDAQGHRIYLLAQSYMPAQDIHIVNNPSDPAISPWYRADAPAINIETPEYTFTVNQLRQWPTQGRQL